MKEHRYGVEARTKEAYWFNPSLIRNFCSLKAALLLATEFFPHCHFATCLDRGPKVWNRTWHLYTIFLHFFIKGLTQACYFCRF
jgi:hypothetical protein